MSTFRPNKIIKLYYNTKPLTQATTTLPKEAIETIRRTLGSTLDTQVRNDVQKVVEMP